MYGAGGGGCGDGDLMSMVEDENKRPSMDAIIRMCRFLKVQKDDYRTINNDDAWEYFYGLFSRVTSIMPREKLYEFLGSYLFPEEIDEHLAHIEQLKRKTA